MVENNKCIILKPSAVGKTVLRTDTGQRLLYIEVLLSEEGWVTWVIPETSAKIIDNDWKGNKMTEESEDLKYLKSIEHPCGHFDMALKEIENRDKIIASMQEKLDLILAKLSQQG